MSRLRTYHAMKRKSDKTVQGEAQFLEVYRAIDQRSGGRCEYVPLEEPRLRCTYRAADHHHLYKPRASHHREDAIVHLCRHHHERCEWPYKRGRLVVESVGIGPTHRFLFTIRYGADKFSVRREDG